MNQDYTDIIQRLSQLLYQAIAEREVNLSDGIKQLDGELAKLLRVKEKLLIEHGERSIAVKRALTDFGAEESFGQAAKRFQEHYGWKVERSSLRREVESIANAAQQYVESRSN